MNTDSFYCIGSTHHECQDYALADEELVLLSDGCSSAKNSDWGARLLVKCFQNSMQFLEYTDQCFFNIVKEAKNHVNNLFLNEDCLAATILGVFYKDPGQNYNKYISTFIVGDGYVFARNRDNKNVSIWNHQFKSGAPWYPYYLLHQGLKNDYLKQFGGSKFTRARRDFDKNREEIDLGFYYRTPQEFETSDGMRIHGNGFDIQTYDLVGIASDGLGSFIRQEVGNTSITNKPLDACQVLLDLLDFKTLEGRFVQRRCQRFLKDCAGKGIKHTDDFSIGVIHV
jgi:hypothetical protein